MNNSSSTILVLNDMGGSIMNVSDKSCTLRAQMKHHEPIVCFEPGIMSRDCSSGNRAYINICSTLRAQMGDNQPAIAYRKNNTSDTIVLEGNGSRPTHRGDGYIESNIMYTLNTIEKHCVCYSTDLKEIK